MKADSAATMSSEKRGKETHCPHYGFHVTWKNIRKGIIIFCFGAFLTNVLMILREFLETTRPITIHNRDLEENEPYFPDIIICNHASGVEDISLYPEESGLMSVTRSFQKISEYLLKTAAGLTDDASHTENGTIPSSGQLEHFGETPKLLVRNFLYYNLPLTSEQILAVRIPPEQFIVSCKVRHDIDFDCAPFFSDFVTDMFGTCQKLDLSSVFENPSNRLSGFVWGVDLLLYLPEDLWTPWIATSSIGARLTLSHKNYPEIPEAEGTDINPGQKAIIQFNQEESIRQDDCEDDIGLLVGADYSQKYSKTLCWLHCYSEVYETFANCSASHYFGSNVCETVLYIGVDLKAMATTCYKQRCPQSCRQQEYKSRTSFSTYPSMHEATYLIAKLLVSSQNQTSSTNQDSTVSEKVVKRYLTAVEEGKRVTCNPTDDHKTCDELAFKYAIEKTKKSFAYVHVYRDTSSVHVSSQWDNYSVFTLISNIGAQLGLWGGITFVSLYDWLVLQSQKLICRKMMKVKPIVNQSSIATDDLELEEETEKQIQVEAEVDQTEN